MGDLGVVIMEATRTCKGWRSAAGRSRGSRWTSEGASSSAARIQRQRKSPGSGTRRTSLSFKRVLSVTASSGSSGSQPSSSAPSTTLPSPARRLQRLDVPCLVASVEPRDVLDSTASWTDLQVWLRNTADARGTGGANGVCAIVIGGSDDANALYEASIKAKEVLKSFPSVALLLSGRPDIAAACGCEGVVLSETDIPTVAARKILGSDESSEQASIVIREVADAERARKGAEEGASALLVDCSSGARADLEDIKSSQRGAASIPILVRVGPGSALPVADYEGVDGIVGEAQGLGEVGLAVLEGDAESKFGRVFASALLSREERDAKQGSRSSGVTRPDEALGGADGLAGAPGALGLKDAIEDGLLVLRGVVDSRAPRLIDGQDGNASMLIADALQALNEAILLVIVGEFNAGKSSVINALLRDPLLPTGVVPTTNEVCMIKYGEEAEMSQQEDGTFLKTVPWDMLKSMTIVDTPGTNVVLERQQKLTEDFIPKADLVLFTLSADRPLTESETKFMTFIKQWSKKIVFVVNKKELLTEQEVQEVSSFVKKNASQILGLEEPPVYPVSARLESQKSADSGFEELFQVIKSVTGSIGEGAKLKFQTALSLGQSLCNALKQQIKVKDDILAEEMGSVNAIEKQLKKFRREMQKDANVQYSNINRALDSVFTATEELTDNLLSLSNAKDITGYITGSRTVTASPSTEILNNFETALRAAVAEHRGWLMENCNQQYSYYNSFLDEKARGLSSQATNLLSTLEGTPQAAGSGSTSLEVDDLLKTRLNAEEALLTMSSEVLAKVYEDSIAEAATTSFGTAGAAVVLTLLLTFVLNSFTEDLLILGFGGAVAYLSVLSIPLQRAKVKLIIRSKLQDYIKSLTDALKKDMEVALDETSRRIEAMAVPVEKMILNEMNDLEELKREQAELESTFEGLLVKVSALED